MATYWSGSFSVTEPAGVPETGGSHKAFVPGTYTCTITVTEVDGDPDGNAPYSSYVWIGDPDAVAGEGVKVWFKWGATPSPGGDTTVFHTVFVVHDPVEVGGTMDVEILSATYDGSSGSGLGRATNTLNRNVVPDFEYGMWAGSAGLGVHHPGNHTDVEWLIESEGDPPPEPEPEPPADGIQLCVLDETFVDIDCLVATENREARIVLKDVGFGKFTINRYSPEADATILKQGNWVHVIVPRIWDQPIFLWQMETGRIVTADFDEEGGETVTWQGRGALSYLERYKAMPRSEVVPAGIIPGGVYVGPASTGGKAGQLLNRFLAEAQHAELGLIDFGEVITPLELLIHDFDYDDDSSGDPWEVTPSTADLAQGQVGETGLYSAAKLIGTGALDIVVEPWQDTDAIPLRAFNHYGVDRTSSTFATGKVRFVRGVNIADRVETQIGTEIKPTHTIVQGQDDNYGFAIDPAATEPDVLGFVQTQGTDPAFLEEVGLSDMARKLREGQSITFNMRIGKVGTEDELTGKYLPGPVGSNGHFWIGDDITLHTGDGSTYGDITNESVRVMAITLSEDDAGSLQAGIEVMWTRLAGRIVRAGGMGTGSVPGGTTGGGTTTPPPPAASTLHSHDHGALTGLTDDDHSQYIRHFIQIADPAASAREGDLWVEAS